LRSAKNVRRAVKEDEIVVAFDLRELLLKDKIGRAFGLASVFTFEINKVESGRNKIESRKKFLTILPLEYVAQNKIFNLSVTGLENRIDLTLSIRVQLVPPFQPH
jgi:hypothetical protein